MMHTSMNQQGSNMNNNTTKGSVATSVLYLSVSLGLLAGCAADRSLQTPDVGEEIRASLEPTMATKPVTTPFYSLAELLPPVEELEELLPEPKLDLLVKNGSAREVFLSIVADTNYNMLLHPEVAGNLSMTLHAVTVLEALEAIRDVYGYYFKMEGRLITVYPPTMQTRIFTLNYPHSKRNGSSSLLVSSGGLANEAGDSMVNTTWQSDLWVEITTTVRSIVGTEGGRSVTPSPQSGIMVVRAMPDELLQVDQLLKTAQIAVERQVMLEVKIVEVELYDGFQSGIDWSQMATGLGVSGAIGMVGSSTTGNALLGSVQSGFPSFNAGSASLLESGVVVPPGTAGLYGLALEGHGFQAVLGFLQTRGNVQTLSSPRIATLNNQKALLKVGTDEFFVTDVAGGGTVINEDGTSSSSGLPTLSLTPFFSGISLDVTPQVDSTNNITLHVRPSVTSVVEKLKEVDLGTAGFYKLPLAASSVNEFDTMVRIQDGNIVAIGGLMKVESTSKTSGLPGTSDMPILSFLFGNQVKVGRKKELVVLIRPTIIRTADDWEKQTQLARAALNDIETSRVVSVNGTAEDIKPTSGEK